MTMPSLKFNLKSNLKSSLKFSMLASAAAIFSAVLSAAPCLAEPVFSFSSLATDQDVFPANYPYPYAAVENLVLDFTSSRYIAQPYIQIEYPDAIVQRQFNAFRSVIREFYDLQTLSTPNIRTRDLSSPYTTALSEFCGYYKVTGAAYPVVGTPSATECNPPEPVVSVAAPEPAPQPVISAPVPALW